MFRLNLFRQPGTLLSHHSDSHVATLGKSAGFMMIELLLALLVFTVTAAGLLGLQLSAMRASEDASRFARSALFALNALEQMIVLHAVDTNAAQQFSWDSPVSDSALRTAPGAIPGLALEQSVEDDVSKVTVTWLSLAKGLQATPLSTGAGSASVQSLTAFTLLRWRFAE